jgi:hypothetical protein
MPQVSCSSSLDNSVKHCRDDAAEDGRAIFRPKGNLLKI